MILVLISLIITGVLFDKYFKKRNISYDFEYTEGIGVILTMISVFSFVLLIATVGEALFYTSKSQMMDELNRWHIIMINSAAIGALITFLDNNKTLFIINLLILIFNMYPE